MIRSFISSTAIAKGEAVKGSDIRESILQLILASHPGFKGDDFISIDELNFFRRTYLTSLLAQENGELAQLDREVMVAIQNNSILSEHIDVNVEESFTFGQKLADKIAAFRR